MSRLPPSLDPFTPSRSQVSQSLQCCSLQWERLHPSCPTFLYFCFDVVDFTGHQSVRPLPLAVRWRLDPLSVGLFGPIRDVRAFMFLNFGLAESLEAVVLLLSFWPPFRFPIRFIFCSLFFLLLKTNSVQDSVSSTLSSDPVDWDSGWSSVTFLPKSTDWVSAAFWPFLLRCPGWALGTFS